MSLITFFLALSALISVYKWLEKVFECFDCFVVSRLSVASVLSVVKRKLDVRFFAFSKSSILTSKFSNLDPRGSKFFNQLQEVRLVGWLDSEVHFV